MTRVSRRMTFFSLASRFLAFRLVTFGLVLLTAVPARAQHPTPAQRTAPPANPTPQPAAEPRVLYVKADAPGADNGSSWTDAYRDLQSALAAAEWGDEIWVAVGTYKPTTGTNRNISFVLQPGVGLYGGFAGDETTRTQRNWTTNPTIRKGILSASRHFEEKRRTELCP